MIVNKHKPTKKEQMNKYLKFIFWLLIAYTIGGYVESRNPRIVTKTDVVTETKTVQLQAPKTYICDDTDSNCFEIQYDHPNNYCFNGRCTHIYTEGQLR